MTLDKLAGMVQRGFEDIEKNISHFKEEFHSVQKHTNSELTSLGEVLKLLREDMKILRRESIQNEVDIRDLKARVSRLEKEAGLVR